MKNYWSNWNAMRIIRLALGIIIIVQGILNREWIFVALGGSLALMPLLNVGCCAGSACNTPMKNSDRRPKEVPYQEIK